jgi:anti-sigma B factor antagonist
MPILTNSKDDILTIYFLDPRVLDEAQLEQLSRDVMAELEKTTEERVILDFQRVQFMSSSMLGKLVHINKKCKEFKVKLKLSGISPEIMQVFKITKLDKVLDIEPNEAAARKAFLKRGIFG